VRNIFILQLHFTVSKSLSEKDAIFIVRSSSKLGDFFLEKSAPSSLYQNERCFNFLARLCPIFETFYENSSRRCIGGIPFDRCENNHSLRVRIRIEHVYSFNILYCISYFIVYVEIIINSLTSVSFFCRLWCTMQQPLRWMRRSRSDWNLVSQKISMVTTIHSIPFDLIQSNPIRT